MCCPSLNATCAAFAGFMQFVLCLVLLFAGSTKLVGVDGECIFGSSRHFEGSLCSAISTLGLVSICSALILSVTQSVLVFACGAGTMCIELLGRIGLAVAWLTISILSTIFGAKAANHAHDPSWIIATIVLCWALFLLSLVMMATDIVFLATCGLCCHGPGQRQSGLAMIAELLCLAWLYSWLTGRPHHAAYNRHQGPPHPHHHAHGHHEPLLPGHPGRQPHGQPGQYLPHAAPVAGGFRAEASAPPLMAPPYAGYFPFAAQGMVVGVPVGAQVQQQRFPVVPPYGAGHHHQPYPDVLNAPQYTAPQVVNARAGYEEEGPSAPPMPRKP